MPYDHRDPEGLHDWDDTESELKRVEAITLATNPEQPLCRQCYATATLLPMPGTAWGLDVEHQDDCPVAHPPTPTRPSLGTTSEQW